MAQYTYKLSSAKGGYMRVRVYDNWGDIVCVMLCPSPKDALESINADSMKYNGFPVFGR